MTTMIEPRAVDAALRARDCPVCGADRPRLLHDNAMVGIDRFALGYPVVACDGCGAVYAARVLADEALADYYRTLSKYDDLGQPSALDRHRARLAAEFVARVAGRDASLLDVGCSTGTFLVEARAAGLGSVAGIEPAPRAVDVARERHGLAVEVGDANTFDRFGAFDVVTLLAVLEHLAHPREFVVRLARSLKHGALLVVEIPDAEAFGDYPRPGHETEPFGEFSIEHINFFGTAALAALGRAAGLSVVARTPALYLNGAAGVFVALRNDGGAASGADDRDLARRSVTRYVERCDVAMRDVEARIAAVRGPSIVYGAGSHTARLLASRAASSLDVRTVVDRNANLVGRAMDGHVVAAPDAIAGHPSLPVVVSTFNAIEPIASYVRRTFGNAVVPLYDTTGATGG